ncbi:MAG: pilus assembly protein [Bryobacteraceae bacterium]|nr:pilus assembly protein [Bryobacteraceae bacterium]
MKQQIAKNQRGNALIETAMFVPLLILLLVGIAELGKATYIYFSIHKTLYGLARFIGTRQGINLCDASDPEVLSAKNWAVTGSSDGDVSIISGLTADMIQVRVERRAESSDFPGECECSLTGCDAAAGGRPPDFVVVGIPDGFPVRVRIPYLATQTVLFRPSVRMPFGGT